MTDEWLLGRVFFHLPPLFGSRKELLFSKKWEQKGVCFCLHPEPGFAMCVVDSVFACQRSWVDPNE